MIKVYALNAFMPVLKGNIRDIRVVWTLEELGMPYERVVLSAEKREHKNPEFLKLNPFGKVPVIQDGDFTLFESTAICSYLADKAGKLIPKPGTRERTQYDQWIFAAVTTVEPPAFRVFGFDFFQEKDPIRHKMREDTLSVLDGLFKVFDQELAQRPFLLGDEFSVADIIFTCSCRIVGHTETTAKFKHLTAYLNKNMSRKAFQVALANNG